jgi:nucleoside-diphosphate-sugar epimerase
MRICIIGGTGHIGTPLTAMLVALGHELIVVTSGRTAAPQGGPWRGVRLVRQSYGGAGWTDTIRALQAEVVIDILQGDSPGLYTAVRESCGHFIVCGSLWMFGLPRIVPTPEVTQAPCLFAGYAQRYQQMLDTRARAAADGVAFTAIMPPNICGPGKVPIDGCGGRDPEVHRAHRRGEPVTLPEPGSVLIGPCDAEDVARGFAGAVQHRAAATGEVFNVGSAYALTSLQFIEALAAIHGTPIPVQWTSWPRFATEVLPDLGSHWHFKAHMCPDISKIRSRLGYEPAYTPEQTLERAVQWMVDTRVL